VGAPRVAPAPPGRRPPSLSVVDIRYRWRGAVTNAALNALHAEGFGHPVRAEDVVSRLQRHSLGWVCATAEDAGLVGFVNVAWDGGTHAFLLDTLVASSHRRRGIGRALVRAAAEHARGAGCAWLHVDFETPLRDFYVRSCGFTPTAAGLVALWAAPEVADVR